MGVHLHHPAGLPPGINDAAAGYGMQVVCREEQDIFVKQNKTACKPHSRAVLPQDFRIQDMTPKT